MEKRVEEEEEEVEKRVEEEEEEVENSEYCTLPHTLTLYITHHPLPNGKPHPSIMTI